MVFQQVSWGELTVVIGIGLALIGRKDLPRAARTAGTQIGRVVGLLQGARARADKFASQNELRQLQNELRSGLRELDAVKSELAVSMSGRGMMGRDLGTMVPSADKQHQVLHAHKQQQQRLEKIPSLGLVGDSSGAGAGAAVDAGGGGATSPSFDESGGALDEQYPRRHQSRTLPPIRQTVGAVAEEEWERQGISFKSRAELGVGSTSGYGGAGSIQTSGSVVLANVLKQSLVFDQYDRVVQEQDVGLQSTIDKVQRRVQQQRQSKNDSAARTTTANQGKEEPSA